MSVLNLSKYVQMASAHKNAVKIPKLNISNKNTALQFDQA